MDHAIELEGLSAKDADRIGRKVWGLVRRRFGTVPREVAEPEDLWQYGALAIVRYADAFDPSFGASFDTWAMTKAHRGIQDALRLLSHNRAGRADHGLSFLSLDAPRTDRGATLAEIIPDEDFEFGDPIERRDVAASIARLSERTRIVLDMRFRDDLTLREIGEVLDLTESRVSQIVSRALDKVRGELTVAA